MPSSLSRSKSRRSGSMFWAVAVAALITFGPSIGIVSAQESTPVAEAPYYSDTQGPPQPGGTVRYLLYEDPNSLNPIAGATTISLQVIASILEGLTENAPDGSYVPVLAAELPSVENGGVSADLLTITWTLKAGVLWSDGTPFTSDDVKFTWEAAKGIANGSTVASDFALISDVQTPDSLTVVVSYSSVNAGYLDQFPWILPKHATGEVAGMATSPINRQPIGTGPFKLDEWSSGEYLQLSKNENYREEGKPYLDGLIFLVIPDESVRTAMMIEGDAEVMLWPGTEAGDQIEASGVAMDRTAPGIWVVQLRFNLSEPFDGDPSAASPHPIFGELRTRQAITMGINRDRINHELLSGSTVYEIDSPLQVGWMNCQVEPWVFDVEGAKALLEEVGWRDEDGDGIREAHGVPNAEDGTKLSFTMNGYTGFDTLDLIELAVQEDMKNIGVEVNIENQEFAVIFGTWDDNSPRKIGDFDALIYDSGLPAEPGADIANAYGPSQVPSAENPGGENSFRWVRDDVGEWIAAANASPDLAVRQEYFCKIADALREDVVVFPILQFSEGNSYAVKLHNYTVSTWEWGSWDSENWWLEQ